MINNLLIGQWTVDKYRFFELKDIYIHRIGYWTSIYAINKFSWKHADIGFR